MADPVEAAPENVRSATTLQSRQSEHMSRPILSSTFSLTPTKSSLNTTLYHMGVVSFPGLEPFVDRELCCLRHKQTNKQ